MSKMFCTNCGVEQKEKPNFCFKCGHPLGTVAAKSSAPRSLKKYEEEESDPANEEEFEIPRSLKARIVGVDRQTMTFESLYSNPSRDGRSQRPAADQGLLETLKRKALSVRPDPAEIN